MKTTATVLSILLFLLLVSTVQSGEDPAMAKFNALVDQYFSFYFSFHPTEATAQGFHQYDAKLEDYSAAAQEREIAGLKDFLAKFQSVDGSKLPADTAADRE